MTYIDPQVKFVLEQLEAAGGPPLHTLTPEQARLAINLGPLTGPMGDVEKVENRTIPGGDGDIPIRIYTPKGEGPFPALVYFHGGGWVIGNVDTVDASCSQLASLAGCVVVSVDYRLAPEHPFPAAPLDAYFAANWISEHASRWNGDVSWLTVGGDSAGGNLAAAVALMSRENDGPKIASLIMLYPVTDMRKGANQRYPSYNTNGQGYFLTELTMNLFGRLYFRNRSDAEHVYASPILADDVSKFPRTFIITAEYDPLRDEGEQYATKLQHAGVEVELFRANGLIHGFFNLFSMINANEDLLYIYEKIARFLKEE